MIEKLLFPGETIVDVSHLTTDDAVVDYSIHVLNREGLSVGDEVLLEIQTKAEPCMLIGGNALKLTVESGFGRLAIVDVKSGEVSNTFLEQGVKATVPSDNILYWYENLGDGALVVRDHCDDFDPDNEKSIAKVVSALSGATPLT